MLKVLFPQDNCVIVELLKICKHGVGECVRIQTFSRYDAILLFTDACRFGHGSCCTEVNKVPIAFR